MFPKFDHPIERRQLLFAAGLIGSAGLVGTALGISPAKGAARSVDQPGPSGDLHLTDPSKELQSFVKIDGDLSGAPYAGWYDGTIYLIDRHKVTTPLLGIEGFGLGWTKPAADGTFRKGWKEVGFYKDLRTGRFIDRWHNPYNGRECEILQIHNRSVNVTESVKLPVLVPPDTSESAPSVDVTKQPFLGQWYVNGDMVAVSVSARLEMTNPLNPRDWPLASSGTHISITEFFLEISKRGELLDPRLTRASSVGHWTRICPWLPWMLMGEAPGQILYQAVTRKLSGVDELPPHLRDYTAAHFPDFLQVPTEADFKIPPESSWDAYKRTRQPHHPPKG